MTKQNIIRFINNYLQDKFPEYQRHDTSLLRISKDGLFLYGYLVDRTSSKENVIQCRAYILPLYYPNEFMHISYSSEVKTVSTGNWIELGYPINEEVVLWLIAEFEDRNLFFKNYVGQYKFINYFKDFKKSTLKTEPDVIYTAILSGEKFTDNEFESYFSSIKNEILDNKFEAANYQNVKDLFANYKESFDNVLVYMNHIAEQSISRFKLEKVLEHSVKFPNGI